MTWLLEFLAHSLGQTLAGCCAGIWAARWLIDRRLQFSCVECGRRGNPHPFGELVPFGRRRSLVCAACFDRLATTLSPSVVQDITDRLIRAEATIATQALRARELEDAAARLVFYLQDEAHATDGLADEAWEPFFKAASLIGVPYATWATDEMGLEPVVKGEIAGRAIWGDRRYKLGLRDYAAWRAWRDALTTAKREG